MNKSSFVHRIVQQCFNHLKPLIHVLTKAQPYTVTKSLCQCIYILGLFARYCEKNDLSRHPCTSTTTRAAEILSEIVKSSSRTSQVGETLSGQSHSLRTILHRVALQAYGNVQLIPEVFPGLTSGFLCLGNVGFFKRQETQQFLLDALEESCEPTQATALRILHDYFHAEEQIVLSLERTGQNISVAQAMTTTRKDASHDE